MHLIFVLLVLTSLTSVAKENGQLLKNATIEQEKSLLENHRILPSDTLEKECMKLALDLKFEMIKQCKIINSPNINAYVLANGHVYFSLPLMQQLKNKHQWASILAHENAHLELSHYIKILEKYQNPGVFFPKSKIKKMMKKHEKQADEWSDDRLKKHGYNADQIYYFMQRVIKIQGNEKNNSHQKKSKRTKKSEYVELLDESLIKSIHELN